MTKALALIVVPLLCGALYFAAAAPAHAEGAYVETASGVYLMPACNPSAALATDATESAPAVGGEVRAMFLVLGGEPMERTHAAASTLGLRVRHHAEPGRDFGWTPLPTVVAQLHPRVVRITSTQRLQWDPADITNTVHQEALRRHPVDRSTTEVLLELEVPSATGGCRFAVVLGPPPGGPRQPLNWFVPPGDLRP